MAHRRAMLTRFRRLLLVQRVCEMKWSLPRAAESAGVSRMTVYKWVRRCKAEGLVGLEDRSSRPQHSPRLTSANQVAAVLELRRRRRWGPHRIGPAVGLARSTVYAVLRRHGEARLSDGDRSTGLRIRYVRERPGELLHIGVDPAVNSTSMSRSWVGFHSAAAMEIALAEQEISRAEAADSPYRELLEFALSLIRDARERYSGADPYGKRLWNQSLLERVEVRSGQIT